MNNIEVKILDHNLNGMAKFLAMLTQRGHQITCMDDVTNLYDRVIKTPPSENLLSLPHTTIKRMNHLTIAITGLSTKAVSQLRTHATRLTFISTSTQYSAFNEREDNFVTPWGLTYEEAEKLNEAYFIVNELYDEMIKAGMDKDKASYILPQGLRKALIISGNLDAWQYVISTRLCHRNTFEVQQIMRKIYTEIEQECGEEYLIGFLPKCVYGKCEEGKFSCGKGFQI